MTTTVNADPKRPYKAIVAGIVAALAVVIAQGATVFPAWLLVILAAAMAGLATFLTPNPVSGNS